MELKDLLNFYIEAFKVIAWPGLILIFLLIFRKNISGFFKRLTSIKISKDLIEISSGIKESSSPPPSKLMVGLDGGKNEFSRIPVDKLATLFWCANDLMWIQDMLYRDAPGWTIVKSLENLKVYINDLGYQKPLIDDNINLLIQDVKMVIEPGSETLNRSFRLNLVRKIEDAKMFLAERVQESEPSFKKLRVFKPDGFDNFHS